MIKKLKYYYQCGRWLWKNRDWKGTRQKYKTMEKELKKYEC